MNSATTFESKVYAQTVYASVKTIRGARYLKQLCKHFSHKVTVNYSDCRGDINFSIGACHISCTESLLNFRCSADEEVYLNDVVQTICRHFYQYSKGENLLLDWMPIPTEYA